MLADRDVQSMAKDLRRMMLEEDGQLALELLWALAQTGGLDVATGLAALDHEDPHVRLWAVRLLEDHGLFSPEIAERVLLLTSNDSNIEVLSQIACTAKRVGGRDGLSLAMRLSERSEIADDPHLPLLIWWVVEACCGEIPNVVVDKVAGKRFAVPGDLTERVMRRFAMRGKREDFERCAKLLRFEQDKKQRQRLLEPE